MDCRAEKAGGSLMQLNMTTDYAIRILLCLGNPGRTLSGPSIAETTRVPPNYLMKMSRKLRKAGLIDSMAGSQGGYYLRKPLNQITLLEVMRTMEPSCKWNRCLEDNGPCNGNTVAGCPVRKYYARLQKELETKWLSRTLAEIVALDAAEEAADLQEERAI